MSNPRATTENMLKNFGFKGRIFDAEGGLTKEASNFWQANFGGRGQKDYFAKNQTIFKNYKYDQRIKQKIDTDKALIVASKIKITFLDSKTKKTYDQYFSLSKKIKSQPDNLLDPISYGGDDWQKQALEILVDQLQLFTENYNHQIVGAVLKKPKIFKTKRSKGIQVNNIKLRQASYIQLDGLQEQESWNSKRGTCVYDFINHYFKNSRINKKCLKESFFDELFPGWKYKGLSTEDIKKWCVKSRVNMLALDKQERLLLKYSCPEGKSKTTLCFIVHNAHLYGFTDKTKIKFFSDRFRDREKSIFREAKEKEEKDYKIEIIDMSSHKISTLEYVINFMSENNIELKNKNIRWKKGRVHMFLCDKTNTKYIFKENENDVVKNYFEAEKIKYNGQSSSTFVYKAMEQVEFDISTPNPILRDFFNIPRLKDMTQQGFYGDNKEITNDMYAYDINKCHTSIIENPNEEWIILDFDARIEDYNGEDIVLGLYYIETDDKNLFVGNKVYSSYAIRYALQNNIILKSNIKKYIKASRAKPKRYVKDISETYKEVVNIENPHAKAMLKLLNNSTSGILGKHKKEMNKSLISTSEEEAFIWLGSHLDDDIYCHEITRNDKTFYVYGEKKTVMLEKTNMPMYIQILSEQLVKLHKGINSATGGDWSRLVYRNIDSFTIRGEPSSYEMMSEEKGMFSIDTLPFKYMFHPHKNINVDWNKYQLQWNLDKNIKTSNDYEMLFDYVDQKKSLNIQGRAGFGKTYMIDKLIEKYGDDNVIRMAFTNCAAVRIGGKTIHSRLKFSFSNTTGIVSEKILSEISNNKNLKCIVIDEQGTLGSKLWNLLNQIKNRVNVSFFLFGDFFQIGPIDNNLYFENEIVKRLSDKNICELSYHNKCRHDEELHDVLETIRLDESDDIDLKMFKTANQNQITDFKNHICFTNDKCFEVNELCADKMFDETDSKKVYLDEMMHNLKTFNKNIPDFLSKDYMGVCVGMPILCKGNNYAKEYFNGERFHILDIKRNEEAIAIIMDEKVNTKTREYAKIYLSAATLVIESEIKKGKIIEINTYDFLMHFDIGFAMTNHKVIGATISEAFAVHQINFYYADRRWIYTALSRAKEIAQVSLLER